MWSSVLASSSSPQVRVIQKSAARTLKATGLSCIWLSPFLQTPAGLSNIIGIIVYISANSDDPSQSDNKKSYSYGWSFYFGALSFVLAEMVGVLAVHVFIDKHRQLRTKGRPSLMKLPVSRSSSIYRNRYYQNRGRRHSYRSNHSAGEPASQSFQSSLVRDREQSSSSESKVLAGLPAAGTVGSEFMLYTLAALKDSKIDMAVEDLTTANTHNHTDILPGNCAANRRTTPVWKQRHKGWNGKKDSRKCCPYVKEQDTDDFIRTKKTTKLKSKGEANNNCNVQTSKLVGHFDISLEYMGVCITVGCRNRQKTVRITINTSKVIAAYIACTHPALLKLTLNTANSLNVSV